MRRGFPRAAEPANPRDDARNARKEPLQKGTQSYFLRTFCRWRNEGRGRIFLSKFDLI